LGRQFIHISSNTVKRSLIINRIARWNYRSWLWVMICTGVIFITIPLARNIQKSISDNLGRGIFTYAVLFIITAGFIIVTALLVNKFKVRNTAQYLWLSLCAGLLLVITLQLKKYPEEAVHLLQYGILTIFVFNAFSSRITDWTIYLDTLLFVSVIGAIDEIIQWIVPSRVGSFQDIGINALSGCIFTIAIYKGIRPAKITHAPDKYSIKVVSAITVISLMILGICLALLKNK